VSFVGFMIEVAVTIGDVASAILGVASVTGKHVTDDQVQEEIDQQAGEQDGKSKNELAVGPRDRAADDSCEEQGDAQSLGKVLALEKVGARANKASRELVVLVDGVVRHALHPAAVRAGDCSRATNGVDRNGLFTGRAKKTDVHVREVGISRVARLANLWPKRQRSGLQRIICRKALARQKVAAGLLGRMNSTSIIKAEIAPMTGAASRVPQGRS